MEIFTSMYCFCKKKKKKKLKVKKFRKTMIQKLIHCTELLCVESYSSMVQRMKRNKAERSRKVRAFLGPVSLPIKQDF